MNGNRVLTFTLRERAYISTPVLSGGSQTTEPGKTLMISADPIGALMKSDPNKPDWTPQATALTVTLSRFRDFKYIGTRIALRPASTVGMVDPAHISETTGNNYMHPMDVSNQIHYRRWVGGNIDLPFVRPTGTPVNATPTYSRSDSLNLDLAWMSDPRFNHCNVSQGFDLFARPKRATLETGAAAADSMWAFGDTFSMAPTSKTFDSQYPGGRVNVFRPAGLNRITGGHVVNDGWTYNPLGCFKYKISDESDTVGEHPGGLHVSVTGVNIMAPWFGDELYLDWTSTQLNVDQAVELVRQRYLAPVCILRIPPAYGSKFYWTLYMAHYLAVRKPFLVNTQWTMGRVQRIWVHQDDVPVSNNDVALEYPGKSLLRCEPDEDIELLQAVSPDPFAAAETGHVMNFVDSQGLRYGQVYEMSDDEDLHEKDIPELNEPEVDEEAEAEADGSTVDIPIEAPLGGAADRQGGEE